MPATHVNAPDLTRPGTGDQRGRQMPMTDVSQRRPKLIEVWTKTKLKLQFEVAPTTKKERSLSLIHISEPTRPRLI
eukprot:1250720-Rhodomonas_salina.5